MNHDWMLDISVDGKSEKSQICLCSGDSGTQLEHCGESDAILYTAEDEIFIERVGETPVEIERSSRKRLIKTEHPTRILPNDKIRVGDAEYQVRSIRRINQQRRATSFFGQLANKVLLTSAAAIMLAVIPACSSTGQSKDVASPGVEQQNDVKQDDANSTDSVDVNPVEGKLVADDDKVEDAPVDIVDVNLTEGEPVEIVDVRRMGEAPREPLNNAVPKCENGKTKCSDDRKEIYTCDNDVWKLSAKCNGNNLCKQLDDQSVACIDPPRPMGKPVKPECSGDQTQCGSDNIIQECVIGSWSAREKCAEPFVCKQVSKDKATCVKPE